MSVLQFFGVALGLFIRHLLYKEVSGGPCTVVISANPFITETVTSPSEIKVGCFKYADNLKEAVLGDFTNKINLGNTNEAVKKCAKLARDKDFELFALGRNGLCLSGADMKYKYHKSGTNNEAHCRDGIGIGNNMFVYSLDPAPNLEPLGCYKDIADDRALPVLYASFRGHVNWTKMELTVNKCARVAHDKGYEYFAVQFSAECYGPKNGENNYAKHGNSSKCWVFDNKTGFGVGDELANFVYKIKL